MLSAIAEERWGAEAFRVGVKLPKGDGGTLSLVQKTDGCSE